MTGIAVETLALVMAVATADGDGDSGLNRVSDGSDRISGYGSGRQKQKLRGQATIKNAAVVVAETAVVGI